MKLLEHHPDLSLIRAGQLMELLVRAMEREQGMLPSETVFAAMRQLEDRQLLPRARARALHRVRKKRNEVAHPRGALPTGPEAWRKDAERSLLAVAQAWAWRCGEPEPAELPRARPLTALESLLRTADQLLDQAEEAIERHRSRPQAEALLAQLPWRALESKGIPQAEHELLQLRELSVGQAASNHEGLPVERLAPATEALMRRLVEGGDVGAREEVAHYLNRRAIGALNQLQVLEPLEELRGLAEWIGSSDAFLPVQQLGALEVRNWQRGALLGSLGQVQAMKAAGEGTAEQMREAIASFEAAQRCFGEAADRKRQVIYRGHALVELRRMGETLTPAEEQELSAMMLEAPWSELSEGWSASAFEVGLALKISWVFGWKLPWAARCMAELKLARDDQGQLIHPYEQVIGGLLMQPGLQSRRLLQELKTRAEGRDTVSWISAAYLQQLSEGSRAVPADFSPWWQESMLALRAEERGPLAGLPFNFA